MQTYNDPQGRDSFTQKEADEIRSYLKLARESGKEDQKYIRDHLRSKLYFFISDYTISRKGFTPEDFDLLITDGRVTIQ